jgi:hypothetical protein
MLAQCCRGDLSTAVLREGSALLATRGIEELPETGIFVFFNSQRRNPVPQKYFDAPF